MTNERPVKILPLVNYNIYWPIIGHFIVWRHFLEALYAVSHYADVIIYGSEYTPKSLHISSPRIYYKTIARTIMHMEGGDIGLLITLVPKDL